MSTITETLETRRSTVVDQMQKLAEKAAGESRNLDASEVEQFDKLTAEVEGIDKRLQTFASEQQRARDIEESFRGSGREQHRGGEYVEGAFGKWLRESRDNNVGGFDLARDRGSEQRAIANRGRNVEERVMSSTGGLGPGAVYSQLWEYAVATSQILQTGVTVINTSDGNAIPMPKATVHATGASAAAGANITASDATLTTADLSAIKRGYITWVPNELLADATFDIEGYLSRAAGRELGRLIGAVASTAAVAGYTVSGAVAPSASFGAQASAGQGGDLLIDLFHSVLPEYRTASSWLLADPTAAAVRKIKTSAGDYVWEKSLQVGDPATIEGRPLYIDPNLPSIGTTNKTVYFGDFSSLAVRIAGGLRFERSTEAGFGNDTTGFRALVRTGAVVLDPNAVKYLVHA